MSEPALIDVAEGVQVFAVSSFDARFLYGEIFEQRGYGDLDLPPNAVVVDVGANIGLFVLFVKQRNPDARVLAFEPIPELADTVRRNVALRGLDGVAVHTVALGRVADSDVVFTYYPVAPSISTRYPGELEELRTRMATMFGERLTARMYQGRQVSVPVERLSTHIAAEERVDLLKIDAVGSEVDVLLGVDPMHWPRVSRVLIDVQDVGDRIASSCAILEGAGFQPVVRPAPAAAGDGLNYHIDAVRL